MKATKIYRVFLEKTYAEEVLVVAENLADAHMRALKAESDGEIEFDEYGPQIDITSVYPADMSNLTHKHIKDFGIINEKGDLVYDTSIMDELEEATKREAIEESLKRNHMEFDFAKEFKNGIK